MFQKLLSGFCTQVKRVDTFATLRAIMNPPTPDNHQRLVLTVQQLIQSQPINWKMVHRLQQLKDQYNVPLDMKYLLYHLKEQPIDATKQRFAVDLMAQYFMEDEELFTNIFMQMLRMQDLQFPTLLKLIEIYFQFPEFFDQDKIIPVLVQNVIASDSIDTYDIIHAFEILRLSDKGLNQTNQAWLKDLKEEISEQIVKLLPCFSQKHFRSLIQSLRTCDYQNEPLKLAINKYFQENKASFRQSALIELLNLYNIQFYSNDELKYQILIQINLQKIRGVHESSMLQRFITPNMPLPQQELMANLITLSGIQLDTDFMYSHKIDTNAKKRELMEKFDALAPQINQIVTEIMGFINGQFTQMMKVINLAQALGVRTPQMMIRIRNELELILKKQFVDPSDLLQALNYFEECNIQCSLQDNCVGMQYFHKYLFKEPYTIAKIHYMQRQFAFKQSEDVFIALNEALQQSGHFNLELLARMILLFRYFKIELSKLLIEKFNAALHEYPLKFNTQFDQIQFYKFVEMADWSEKLDLTLLDYYNKGRQSSYEMRKAPTKNLGVASYFEFDVLSELKQILPSEFKLLSSQIVRGTEVDVIIQNPEGKLLFLQLHGKTHCYHQSNEYNYKTVLENFKLSLLGNLKTVQYDEHVNKFDREEIMKILSCLM